MEYLTIQEMMERLGECIQRRRLGIDMMQKTLAKRSGVSLKAVRNVETGANPSLESFIAVCRTLGALDWMVALQPPSMTRDDIERYVKGRSSPRKRASGRV